MLANLGVNVPFSTNAALAIIDCLYSIFVSNPDRLVNIWELYDIGNYRKTLKVFHVITYLQYGRNDLTSAGSKYGMIGFRNLFWQDDTFSTSHSAESTINIY